RERSAGPRTRGPHPGPRARVPAVNVARFGRPQRKPALYLVPGSLTIPAGFRVRVPEKGIPIMHRVCLRASMLLASALLGLALLGDRSAQAASDGPVRITFFIW